MWKQLIAATDEAEKVKLLRDIINSQQGNERNGDDAIVLHVSSQSSTYSTKESLETVALKLIKKMTPEAINAKDDGITFLHFAIKEGLETVALKLIKKMTPEAISIPDSDGDTALHFATENSLTTVALELIKKMTQEAISIPNSNGYTALHFATENSLTTVALELIRKMTQEAISIPNSNGYTALHFATEQGLEILALKLIKKMTPEAISIANSDGDTALHFATENNLKTVALELIKKITLEGNVDAEVGSFKNIALMNATEHDDKQIIHELLKLGADPFLENDSGNSAFFIALREGDVKLATDFIITKQESSTTLPMVAKTLSNGYVQILLTILPDDQVCTIINEYLSSNVKSSTILHQAVTRSNFELTRFLLENKVDVNYKDEYDISPLHLAVLYNDINIAKMLLESGALVNETGPVGFTALHIAAENGRESILKLLVGFNGDVNICNMNQTSLMHSVVRGIINGKGECREGIEHKYDKDQKLLTHGTDSGKECCWNLIEYLISIGADPFVEDNKEKLAGGILADYELSYVNMYDDILEASGCYTQSSEVQ